MHLTHIYVERESNPCRLLSLVEGKHDNRFTIDVAWPESVENAPELQRMLVAHWILKARLTIYQTNMFFVAVGTGGLALLVKDLLIKANIWDASSNVFIVEAEEYQLK